MLRAFAAYGRQSRQLVTVAADKGVVRQMPSSSCKPSYLCSSSGESLQDRSPDVVTKRRKRRGQNKLDAVAVRQIRAEVGSRQSVNIEQLGRKYGVSVSTIKAVLNRRTWKNVD
jgi:hypothetical protein